MTTDTLTYVGNLRSSKGDSQFTFSDPDPVEEHRSAILDAALQYASWGWRVFPVHTWEDGRCTCGNPECEHVAKHPRTSHGFKEATTRQEIIKGWWTKWPGSNIGVATGRDSGLVVLDIDPRNGGNDSLYKLEKEFGRLSDTVESQTGGGGRHFLFKYPNRHIPCKGTIRPGLDLKAEGGYIIAPPSRHASGKLYRWELSSCPDDVELAPLSEWLLQIIMKSQGNGQPGTSQQGAQQIPRGQRNNHLTSLAGSMRRRVMTEPEIAGALLQVNAERCVPPLDDEEVMSIARSVSRYEPIVQVPNEGHTLPDITTPLPFILEDGLTFYEKEVPVTEPLIEEIVGAHRTICIAAPDNAGKSLICHQVGIALAIGAEELLGFKISRPKRVLLLNFEMSEEQFHVRHKLLCSAMPKSNGGSLKNFFVNTFDGDRMLFTDNWDRIRATIEANPPFDLIIVDNLYACTGVDDESNADLKPLLQSMFSIADLYKSSLMVVGHYKKCPPESPLSKSLIRGGSTLINAVDVVLQVGMSLKEPGLRLWKITKNRDFSPNLLKTFGLRFDPTTLWFTITAQVNELAHLTYPKSLETDKVLEEMSDEFEATEWQAEVKRVCNKERSTAFQWLKKLEERGLVKSKAHGLYVKVGGA